MFTSLYLLPGMSKCPEKLKLFYSYSLSHKENISKNFLKVKITGIFSVLMMGGRRTFQ